MTDASEISPCFLFYHRYDRPNPNYDTSRFTIHCTLEKGAEGYYSGVRVIVIAKKIGYDDNFAKAEIRAHHLADKSMLFTEKHINIEPPEDTNAVIDDHALPVDGLPLYTLILELVDLSDATWSAADIIFPPVAEISSSGALQQIPDTHRVLYEYAKRTSSCVLLLATQNVELSSRLKPDNPDGIEDFCDFARIDLPTHGFRILPPSERRPFFAQPPPEILYNIFSFLAHDGSGWRRELVAVSLVCRAWWEVALPIIYKDFDFEFDPLLPFQDEWPPIHIELLETTLKDNPEWGRYIKCLSLTYFYGGTVTQFGDSALTILKTASNMRMFLVGNVSTVLAGEFIEVLCKMNKLRHFIQFPLNIWNDEGSEEKIYLNAAQLTKCFVHWPKLRQAVVRMFGEPHAEDGNEFAPAQCALDDITFENGFVSMAQLRAITASSQDTLHVVTLGYIKGISNKEFTSWLVDFGPNLTTLTLKYNVFTRSEADELAIDATIHMMPRLLHLEIEGPVATVLVILLRFEPTQAMMAQIIIREPVLFDLHAFVKALYTTKWGIVDVEELMTLVEHYKLVEEALRVAGERDISLRVPSACFF